MSAENDEVKVIHQIDFVQIFNYCKKNWRLYVIVGAVAIVVAVIYAFSIPKTYRSEVKLAPEFSSGNSSGSLSSLASMMGVKVGGASSSDDAIYPELYPDLLVSKEFLVSLFDIRIHMAKKPEEMTIRHYFDNEMKQPWWSKITGFPSAMLRKLRGGHKVPLGASTNESKINPFQLSEAQNGTTQAISAALSCNVDKHTSVVTLVATTQDPVATALIVDSVRARLQDFIIAYRTKKARNDVAYSRKLLRDAKKKYDAARQAYSNFSDTHEELYLSSYKTQSDNLENEMQLAYNTYSQVLQQLQVAQAKVLERTPAFTTIVTATVPLLPAGPHKVSIIVMFLILAFAGTTVWLVIKHSKVDKASDMPKENTIAATKVVASSQAYSGNGDIDN